MEFSLNITRILWEGTVIFMFRLGLDIDGCINDFGSLIHRRATVFSKSYGIDKVSDMSDYLLQRFFGWSDSLNKEFWIKYYKTTLSETLPLSGAAQTISLMKHNDIEIYIITARKEKHAEVTIDWLNRYNILYDKLIMCKEKAEACIENCIDLMIEDEPENCESISQYKPVLCMAYKYNECLEGRQNIIRVANWAEIYNEVMRFASLGQAV